MFQINPYRHNCEIIKKFFANPIILIISILFFLASIISFAIELITDNILSIPVSGIISAIGFLLFYIKGKSKKEITSFNEPANLLTVSGILSIVINTFASILCVLFLFISYSGINLLESFASYISIDNFDFIFVPLTFILYQPIFLLNILSAIAILILSYSFKKSSSSIYLYKKGSIFFAVTSFCLALTQILFIIYNGISIQSVIPTFEAILSITLGIFSIMYNRYISNVSSNIFVPQPKTETINKTETSAPTAKDTNYVTPLANMWDIAENRTGQSKTRSNNYQVQSSSFDPQPVFVQNNETLTVTNPYATTHKEEKQFLFCNFCGKKCSPNNLFCGNCGNKLIR